MAYKIDVDTCVGCGACEGTCPASAIIPKDGKYEIEAGKCVDCGACEGSCPVTAISKA